MDVSPDYEDLFKSLNAHKVKYLVVGAQAVIFHTEPRWTKDMDVWIPSELNDPEKVFAALKDFGASLVNIVPDDFRNKKMFLQIGVAPVRIDILVGLEGAKATRAWQNRRRTFYGKTPIYVMGVRDVYRTKRSAGRSQDLLDMEKLLQWYPRELRKLSD